MTSSDLRGRTVLFLHAHPDDEAIFTGITIRRLAEAGARVVLVMATDGDLGEAFVALHPGESIAGRRGSELAAAVRRLGVSRLVSLGYRDSGVRADPGDRDTLAAANVAGVAEQVAAIARVERAEALVHYDAQGIYEHPDHVAVHRIGRAAARLAGITAYESTVDREHLHLADGRNHLIYAASRATRARFGHPSVEITLAIAGSEAELAAKRDAIAAHGSQIPAGSLDEASFASAYGLEWYIRDGARSVLDELGNAHIFA
ncbi:MAG TPA: PIG-L family deacetylase [Mycobacteriales bacterium]|nr:PIG-L family deacetylase [Mycobacteriales bacterium]